MFFLLLSFIFSTLADDLMNANQHVMAQAFMERCIDQGDDEVTCREKTIEMFGTTGLTEIDININPKGGAKQVTDDLPVRVLFHKGSKDTRSRTCNKSECIAPNTIYYGGQCHCRLFFDHGSPIGKGCWRCKPKCKSHAICTLNDGCQCQNYTVGDGYKKCETHIPTILRVYSKLDMKTVIVEIKSVPWNYPRVAYCKFSNVVVEGKLITNHTIKCVRKTTIKKDTKVDVSWDSISYTHQKMEVIDRDLSDGDIGPIIIIVVIIFFLIIVYFLFLLNKGASKGMDLDKYADAVAATGKL